MEKIEDLDALMTDFIETVEYVGPVRPWREVDELDDDPEDEEFRAAGGPGSGNFGHAGRPGEVGGSGSSTDLPHGVTVTHSTEYGDDYDFVLPDGRGSMLVRTKWLSGERVGQFTPPPGYGSVSLVGVRDKGRGEAVKLYEAALVHLQKLGYKGISSHTWFRQPAAQKMWDSFKRHGATIERQGDWELLTKLSGRDVTRSLGGAREVDELDDDPDDEEFRAAASANNAQAALHAVADRYEADLEVAVRYAFALGRREVHDKLQHATTLDEIEEIMSVVPAVVEAALLGVLPGTLARIARAGAGVGRGLLRGRLRAAGGPGSGNFGHSGGEGGEGNPGGSSRNSNAWIGKPVSAYTPMFEHGRDTRERFSDGKGNYTPERKLLHEEIIAKALRGTTPVDEPLAVILGGAPGVGKSTLVAQENIGKENTVQINVDDLRNDLPEYAPDANGKRPPLTAMTHEEASDISAKLIMRSASTSRNLVLDGTGDSTVEKLGGKIAVLRSKGHKVDAIYVTTSVEVAQQRADGRTLNTNSASFGRVVPPTAMREMHAAVSRVFPEAVKQGMFDKVKLWDSTGKPPVLVASGARRNLTIHNQPLWLAFLEKGNR